MSNSESETEKERRSETENPEDYEIENVRSTRVRVLNKRIFNEDVHQVMTVSSSDPKSIQEALSSENSTYWVEAMEKEFMRKIGKE